jgi:hypothetical protein
MDPDPAIFVIDLQDANKKLFIKKVFLFIAFTPFFKDKRPKKSQNSRNQDLSYCFCLMIEGSGSGAGFGSIPLTNGSGSGRSGSALIGSFAS